MEQLKEGLNANETLHATDDSSITVPAIRVKWYPKDTDETFIGTVIEETTYSYLVIPDYDLGGTARWNKRYCDVLR